VPFSPMQQEYFKNATHRWNFKTGATRSGKTFMDYFVIPKRIERCTGDGLIVIIGHTKQTVQKNVIDPMQRIWGMSLVGNVSQTTGATKIFGKRCYVVAADNKARVDALRGSSIEYCYGDEVATWDKGLFEMLKSRLDRPASTFDGTCNPDTPSHWLKEFLDSEADIYQQSYTIYDNPFLQPEFVHNLEKEYAGTVYFDRYILGRWTLAEGLVYKNFDPEKNTYSTPLTEEVIQRSTKYIAVDYGTANPMVFLKIYHDPEAKIIYVDDEYYYDGRKMLQQKTDLEFAQDLQEFAGDNVRAVIIDPSALSFRVQLRRLGFICKEADNDVKNGIQETAALLSSGQIKVNRRNENMIKEFGTYAWNEKAAMQTGEDSVIKQNDHAMDALRYYIKTVVNMRRMLA